MRGRSWRQRPVGLSAGAYGQGPAWTLVSKAPPLGPRPAPRRCSGRIHSLLPRPLGLEFVTLRCSAMVLKSTTIVWCSQPLPHKSYPTFLIFPLFFLLPPSCTTHRIKPGVCKGLFPIYCLMAASYSLLL